MTPAALRRASAACAGPKCRAMALSGGTCMTWNTCVRAASRGRACPRCGRSGWRLERRAATACARSSTMPSRESSRRRWPTAQPGSASTPSSCAQRCACRAPMLVQAARVMHVPQTERRLAMNPCMAGGARAGHHPGEQAASGAGAHRHWWACGAQRGSWITSGCFLCGVGHEGICWCAGRNFLVKVNANIGNSAVTSSIEEVRCLQGRTYPTSFLQNWRSAPVGQFMGLRATLRQ